MAKRNSAPVVVYTEGFLAGVVQHPSITKSMMDRRRALDAWRKKHPLPPLRKPS